MQVLGQVLGCLIELILGILDLYKITGNLSYIVYLFQWGSCLLEPLYSTLFFYISKLAWAFSNNYLLCFKYSCEFAGLDKLCTLFRVGLPVIGLGTF